VAARARGRRRRRHAAHARRVREVSHYLREMRHALVHQCLCIPWYVRARAAPHSSFGAPELEELGVLYRLTLQDSTLSTRLTSAEYTATACAAVAHTLC
jgi:hypothetical protein